MASLTLGSFIRSAREAKNLRLRDVEREVGVSNAYLSQLETGQIKEPSPNILFKLAGLYEIDYAEVMTLAGYPTPKATRRETSSAFRRRIHYRLSGGGLLAAPR